jgi:hypothetical protein
MSSEINQTTGIYCSSSESLSLSLDALCLSLHESIRRSPTKVLILNIEDLHSCGVISASQHRKRSLKRHRRVRTRVRVADCVNACDLPRFSRDSFCILRPSNITLPNHNPHSLLKDLSDSLNLHKAYFIQESPVTLNHTIQHLIPSLYLSFQDTFPRATIERLMPNQDRPSRSIGQPTNPFYF